MTSDDAISRFNNNYSLIFIGFSIVVLFLPGFFLYSDNTKFYAIDSNSVAWSSNEQFIVYTAEFSAPRTFKEIKL